MLLEGSCYCKSVTFSVTSRHPYPFMRCYCSICRKTAGSGGYAINLSADFTSLQVQGADHIRTFHIRTIDPETGATRASTAQRSFCGDCGSALWNWDPLWADLMHPFASAIDTDLPTPPEHTHIMLASKPGWVGPDIGPDDQQFDEYPNETIAQWHDRVAPKDQE